MTSVSRAQELRALADKYEAVDGLREEADAAKSAYSEALAGGDADQIAAARERHRAASAALNEGRSETRDDLMVAAATPGSATVRPGGVHAGPVAGAPTVVEG